jgi:hypothetical protein
MSKWVRNPPSAGRLKLIAAVIAVCVAIVVLDHYGFWPDWAQGDLRKDRWRP